MRLLQVDGAQVPVNGITDLKMYLEGLIITHKMRVSNLGDHDIILGLDFLKENGAVIAYSENILTLRDDLVMIPLYSNTKHISCISAAKNMRIPPFAEALIPVISPTAFNNQSVLLEPLSSKQFRNFAVAKAIVNCANNASVCRILNTKPYVLKLKCGVKLAKIESFNTISEITEYKQPNSHQPEIISKSGIFNSKSSVELHEFPNEYGITVGDKLNSNQKQATLQLLYNYKDIFARSLLEVKECKAPPMKLTLHTNQKMFKRQYKLNEEDSKEASRQIKEMLDNEIIEPSDTAYYNSPVFLIKKIRWI